MSDQYANARACPECGEETNDVAPGHEKSWETPEPLDFGGMTTICYGCPNGHKWFCDWKVDVDWPEDAQKPTSDVRLKRKSGAVGTKNWSAARSKRSKS